MEADAHSGMHARLTDVYTHGWRETICIAFVSVWVCVCVSVGEWVWVGGGGGGLGGGSYHCSVMPFTCFNQHQSALGMQLFILIETEKGSCRVRVRPREGRGGEGGGKFTDQCV